MAEQEEQAKEIDRLASDLAIILLAEWIAIEHNKTRLEALQYLEEAQDLADWLTTIGYTLKQPSQGRNER